MGVEYQVILFDEWDYGRAETKMRTGDVIQQVQEFIPHAQLIGCFEYNLVFDVGKTHPHILIDENGQPKVDCTEIHFRAIGVHSLKKLA